MHFKRVAIGGIFLFAALMFMFPDSSRVGNFCYPASPEQMDSPFPFYLEGCNMWIRANPTYLIFGPLTAFGIFFLILGLRDDPHATVQRKA